MLLSSSVPAAANAQARGIVDSIARSFKVDHRLPALVIGVIDSAGERIMPYGVARVGSSAEVTGDTRFEVGSVSKVFTSLLLAKMVQKGDVHLDDPVARYSLIRFIRPSTEVRR